MTDDGTVNSQVVDSVTGTQTQLIGQSPAGAFGMMDVVLAETLGMAMHNAVARQQGAGMIGSASVTAACAKMLGASVPIPPPPSPTPPTVQPLPGPPSNSTTGADIDTAYKQAEEAISEIQQLSATASSDAEQAQQDLEALAKKAEGGESDSSGDTTLEGGAS